MDDILRLAGLDGFLTNFEASEHAFDPRFAVMAKSRATTTGAAPSRPRTGSRSSKACSRTASATGADRRAPPRARATIVGSLFTDYVGTRFEMEIGTVEVVRIPPLSARRSPECGFQAVSP